MKLRGPSPNKRREKANLAYWSRLDIYESDPGNNARVASLSLEAARFRIVCGLNTGDNQVAEAPTRALIPARAGVSRWNARNRIWKAIIAGATALSLAASALATAEPAAAQWRGGRDGDSGWRGPPGEAGSVPYFGNPRRSSGEVGASAPYWSDDSCWQVRPIYSISGAWLDNRRVNVCH